jgi:putative ABC transport system permease protein
MLKNYLLTAWTVFQRRKLFTAINLACIVLTLVVLLVVTAILQEAFYPQGVEHRSDRFLQVIQAESMHSKNTGGWRRGPLGYKLIEKYLKPIPGLEAVAAVSGTETASIYQDGRVHEVQMRHADADYWRIMDFQVLAGRVPVADDVDHGRMVAVLNQSTARQLFGLDAALGRKVDVGGQVFDVIGVVADAMHMNSYGDIWVPVTTYPNTEYRQQMAGNFFALLMVQSPDQLPALREKVAAAAKTVVQDDPKKWDTTYMWADSKIDTFARVFTQSREVDAHTGSVMGSIAAVMVLFMLLPALNLVNLNMGRIMERATEIGVRKAFGARNGQLMAQLVLENVLLCLAGGALALPLARIALWWVEAISPFKYTQVGLNLAVFGWGLLITIVFGVLSGVIPAWKMARLDPVHALKGAA